MLIRARGECFGKTGKAQKTSSDTEVLALVLVVYLLGESQSLRKATH